MIIMPGKNNFKNFFNPFEWSAPIYETPEEVLNEYKRFGISNKKIAGIRAIGGSSIFNWDIVKRLLERQFRDSGIPKTKFSKWKNFDKFLIDRIVIIAEPTIITFDDGSTFEFCSYRDGNFRMSINAIPPSIENGLNNSNFDFQKLVPNGFIGSKLGDLTILEYHDHSHYFEYDSGELSNFDWRKCTEYSFSGRYNFNIKHKNYLQYEIYFTKKYEDNPEKIECKKFMEARKKINQLYIHQGCVDDDEMRINPFYDNKELLSKIDQFIVNNFLFNFHSYIFDFIFTGNILCRYFDKSVNIRDRYSSKTFDPYTKNNYTFDSLKKMISRMRIKNYKMLTSSYDDQYIKYDFEILTPSHDWYVEPNNSEDDEVLIAYYKNLISDFRERFYSYMDGLMKVSNINGFYIEGGL